MKTIFHSILLLQNINKEINKQLENKTCLPWRTSMSMRGIPIASAATAIETSSFLRVFSTTPFTSLKKSTYDMKPSTKLITEIQ